MTTIKAKVIDDFHPELAKGIPTKTGNKVFIKIIERKPIASLRGSRGYDVDSADFVNTLRKSGSIRYEFFPVPTSGLIAPDNYPENDER